MGQRPGSFESRVSQSQLPIGPWLAGAILVDSALEEVPLKEGWWYQLMEHVEAGPGWLQYKCGSEIVLLEAGIAS